MSDEQKDSTLETISRAAAELIIEKLEKVPAERFRPENIRSLILGGPLDTAREKDAVPRGPGARLARLETTPRRLVRSEPAEQVAEGRSRLVQSLFGDIKRMLESHAGGNLDDRESVAFLRAILKASPMTRYDGGPSVALRTLAREVGAQESDLSKLVSRGLRFKLRIVVHELDQKADAAVGGYADGFSDAADWIRETFLVNDPGANDLPTAGGDPVITS